MHNIIFIMRYCSDSKIDVPASSLKPNEVVFNPKSRILKVANSVLVGTEDVVNFLLMNVIIVLT